MHSRHSFMALALYATSCAAVTLYAAASDGNVSTLSLNTSNFTLTEIAKTPDCGPNSATLSLDFDNRILYCVDRGSGNATNGSINSFSINSNGNLTLIDRVLAPLGGVSSEIVGDDKRGLISVSFNASAVTVHNIDDGGVTGQLSDAVQQFFPTIPEPGPVADRQDHSYLHQVLQNPEKTHVFVCELGGDMIRVFNQNADTLELTELAPLVTDEKGVGPRHAVFWTSPTNEKFIMFVGELSQNVYTYKITSDTADAVTWEKVGEIPALGVDGAKPALTSPTSEIALSPDQKFIVVSNRDVSFRDSTQFQSGPTDTLSTFSINEDGTLTLVQLAPSGGYSPRQFSINKAGDLLAVGHQSNKTVVVWKRDVASGLLVTEGGPAATITLTGAVVVVTFDE